MADSRKLFVTESAFIGFIDRSHPKHTQAAAYFRYFGDNKYQLYTGFLNVAETTRMVYEDVSPSLARDFLQTVILGSINILYPTEADVKAAVKALVTSQSNELTFEEAQMEVLAYRNNINQIFTFSYLPPLFGLTTFSLPI